jgi:MoaA/NifB/PqqE/SkfB family radical SAM enzyme
MNSKPGILARVEKDGRLALPPELITRYGLLPDAEVWIDDDPDTFRVQRPITHLAKVYLEPTNRCNLNCVTCVRNVWTESLGHMDMSTFARIVEGLRAFTPPPVVFFGGFGEPLAHREIVSMITQVKALGARVELITNGTLLDEALARQLIAAQIDMLWVSLDGTTPESFADVRLGAALPQILDNVMRFRELRSGGYYPRPELGIAFVAMKRNIAQLPDLLALSRWLGAAYVKVTNVLPYTTDLRDEILYWRVLMDSDCLPSPGVPYVILPKININDVTRRPLYHVLNSHRTITYAGFNLQSLRDRCPFIEGGVVAIAWDGGVSPCLPLMHDHVSYVDRYERHSRRYTVGNVNDSDLIDIWQQPDHLAFRRRVREFDFAPCTSCGGCQLLEANEEDCIGNTFPTCGGCLWAQGVIQCP